MALKAIYFIKSCMNFDWLKLILVSFCMILLNVSLNFKEGNRCVIRHGDLYFLHL